MKAAIISLGSKSSRMTADAMEKYFDQVDMIELRNIEVVLGKQGGVFYRGKKLEEYDCVYIKGSYRYSHLLHSIAAMLEGKVPYMPLPAHTFTTVHNKLLTHLKLQQQNINMPNTYVSPTVDEAKDILERVNYPIVMKFPEGTQGRGVMFADSIASASSMLDALGALNQPFIIQQYVETGGEDIRALVVGEKVVASMKRKAQKEEKRANLHAGGTGETVLLSREANNLALDTAKALGAEVCGVDILDGPLGPMVIEANISPGLQGLNAVSTLDVSDEIAKYLFRKTEEAVNENKQTQASKVMQELDVMNGNNTHQPEQQIVTNLTFRGDRIILPEVVNKFARLSDRKEYTIKIKKGKISIEETSM